MADLSSFTNQPATRAFVLQAMPRAARTRTTYTFTGTVILADVSGSMRTVDAGGKRRIESLRGALADVHKPGTRLVAFADGCTELASPARLPEPSGGTMLHLAIDHVLRPPPRAVIVITDGAVDDEARTLRSADVLPTGCTVSALYVGPDDDREAIGFLKELCRRRGGRVEVRDLAKLLPAQDGRQTVATAIRGLLA